mgnify:CR=1 FL=1
MSAKYRRWSYGSDAQFSILTVIWYTSVDVKIEFGDLCLPPSHSPFLLVIHPPRYPSSSLSILLVIHPLPDILSQIPTYFLSTTMGTMGGVTTEDVVILMLLIALTTLWALIVIFCVEWWRLLRTLNPPGSDPRVPVTWELSIAQRPKQD